MREAKRYVIRNSYDGKFYNGKNTFKPGIFGELEKAKVYKMQQVQKRYSKKSNRVKNREGRETLLLFFLFISQKIVSLKKSIEKPRVYGNYNHKKD